MAEGAYAHQFLLGDAVRPACSQTASAVAAHAAALAAMLEPEDSSTVQLTPFGRLTPPLGLARVKVGASSILHCFVPERRERPVSPVDSSSHVINYDGAWLSLGLYICCSDREDVWHPLHWGISHRTLCHSGIDALTDEDVVGIPCTVVMGQTAMWTIGISRILIGPWAP